MRLSYSLLAQFVKPYTVPLDSQCIDIVDLENPPPPPDAKLPCVPALEFLADIHEQTGDQDDILKAVEVRVQFTIQFCQLFVICLPYSFGKCSLTNTIPSASSQFFLSFSGQHD